MQVAFEARKRRPAVALRAFSHSGVLESAAAALLDLPGVPAEMRCKALPRHWLCRDTEWHRSLLLCLTAPTSRLGMLCVGLHRQLSQPQPSCLQRQRCHGATPAQTLRVSTMAACVKCGEGSLTSNYLQPCTAVNWLP